MFALFAGEAYYPFGGWEDFHGVYDSLEAAREAARGYDWAHVVDLAARELVWEGVVR